jgi:hypothetical protein
MHFRIVQEHQKSVTVVDYTSNAVIVIHFFRLKLNNILYYDVSKKRMGYLTK